MRIPKYSVNFTLGTDVLELIDLTATNQEINHSEAVALLVTLGAGETTNFRLRGSKSTDLNVLGNSPNNIEDLLDYEIDGV